MGTSARYPMVVMEEPGHKEVEAAEGFPDKLDTIRKAMLKAVASATHVVVSHFGVPKAYIFGPKDEADASRVYAGFGWYCTKTMWSAGEDEAVASSGNSKLVELCDKLAHKVLDNAAACHAESGATAECSSDEDHDCHDHSEEVDITCWMVGSKNTDDLQLKAYGDEEKARQQFNASARRLPTVLIGQPGNDVIDSSGDDGVVQKLTKEVAAAAASAKCAVVRHTGYVWGNIYSGDDAMVSARNEYAHIKGAQGQAMWCADKDQPLATNGDARCIDTCNDLARKLLAVGATAEVDDHSDDHSDSETENPPAAYWLIGGLLRRSSKFMLKMYLSEAYAKRMYRLFDQGRAMKALILASNPGLMFTRSWAMRKLSWSAARKLKIRLPPWTGWWCGTREITPRRLSSAGENPLQRAASTLPFPLSTRELCGRLIVTLPWRLSREMRHTRRRMPSLQRPS